MPEDVRREWKIAVVSGTIAGVFALIGWRRGIPGDDQATWIREGLLAWRYPKTDADFRTLASNGVTVLLNLHRKAHDPDILAAYGIEEIHLQVRDFSTPSQSILLKGIARIRNARQRGETVCVHCGGGLGRTGTLLACYLVRSEGLDADNAIAQVRGARTGSLETRGQVRCVRAFARWHASEDCGDAGENAWSIR